jgi:hypothetical protein
MQQRAPLGAVTSLVVSLSNHERAGERSLYATSISTSQPFDVGIPVPSVNRPMR